MKEAISKYTALEMRHVVGPRGRDPSRDTRASVRCQGVGSSAASRWWVTVAGDEALGALEQPAHGG